jgi:hypothetical protein
VSDAGHFYALRNRLRASLSRHHWTLGRPFSPIQEDAWGLLNEVEQMANLLRQVERDLAPDNRSEFAYKVRQTVLMHFPAGKSGG